MADFEIAPVGTVAKLAEVKAELEALDAQLDRVKDIIHRDNSATRFSEIVAVMAEKPATSLSRQKMLWQAEAVETAVARGYRSRDELAGWAEHLRRQAEEVGNV